jgi:polar amino acid transport system substrate-binding protein
MGNMRAKRNTSWFMRWLGLVAVLLVAALAFAACGDDDDDGGDDGGNGNGDGGGESITMGIADEAPYGFEDENGNATGEAPEVAREVLSRMGITDVDFTVVEFGNLNPALNAGQFDITAAGQFITPDRAEEVLFTDPDYCGTQAFAVEAGNPNGISDFESIAGNSDVILGVLGGAVEVGYAEDAGVSEDQMQTFDTTANMFEALQDGRINALALTGITINWELQQLGDESLEATPGFLPTDENGEEILGCGAYAFRFEDQEMRDEFNDILNEMKDNDEILPIVEEFGFTSAEMDAAKGVTVEDLVGGE